MRTILFSLIACLILTACGGGGGGEGSSSTAPTPSTPSGPVVVTPPANSFPVALDFGKFFGVTASRSTINASISKALLPGLATIELEISPTPPGMEPVLQFSQDTTSTTVHLPIGQAYTFVVIAKNTAGVPFASGTQNLDLTTKPTVETVQITVPVALVEPGQISSTVYPPAGSNIVAGQTIYFHVDQFGGIIQYTINDSAFAQLPSCTNGVCDNSGLLDENNKLIPIADQTMRNTSNGYPLTLPADLSGDITLVFAAEDASGHLEQLHKITYHVINFTKVKPNISSAAHSQFMTGGNYRAAQLLPISGKFTQLGNN